MSKCEIKMEPMGNIMILNDLQRNMPVYDEIRRLHRVVEAEGYGYGENLKLDSIEL